MVSTQRDRVDPEDDAAPEGGKPADRATRFMARLDTYLPTLADDAARQAFLDRQIEGWEHRYVRFIATEGESEPSRNTIAREDGRERPDADPPQAADFLLTITALAARRKTLGEHGTGCHHV